MAKRWVVVGMAGLLAGVAVASLPASRHALRRVAAAHHPFSFGDDKAVPVVAVPQPMPILDATLPDPRFSPVATADAASEPVVPPLLDAAGFAPPTAIARAAATDATVATIDRTTEPSREPPGADLAFAADLAGARQALRLYHDGNLSAGDDFARLTSGPLRVALDWAAIRLCSRAAGPARLRSFATAHPGWPMRGWIDRRLEEQRAGGNPDTGAVLAMFAAAPPQTLSGKLSLAKARIATGDAAGGASLVAEVWRTDDLSAAEEALVLRDFGTVLRRQDHKFKADRLLYKENVPAALKAAALAGPDVVLLAKARAAVIAGISSDTALAAVPKTLAGDPGLLFARIQKARRAGRIDEAAALMASAPHDPDALVDGDEWWTERRLLARKLLDGGNAKGAYAVVSGALPRTPAAQIEAAFHTGWIALRFLNDPALAASHFAAVSRLAEAPISVARGAYWQGRAADAAGQVADAARFYAGAAALPTTFYGQLAALRLGQGPIALRPGVPAATGDSRSDAVRSVALLFGLGERDLAVSLATAAAKNEPDPAQVSALADAVAATGNARATLQVGKASSQRGIALDGAAFPTFGVPGYQPVEHSADRATVLAIARQESEFEPTSVSSAGAMGLMQMIASTARKTAQDAGIGFDQNRMLTDPAFNARLGAAHLGRLLGDLDGSYILTFAAYNAGPRKAQEWIAAYGDPRKPGVDPVDWIERIPFTETRNYVQRVFENLQIYRAQLGMPTASLSPTEPGRRS